MPTVSVVMATWNRSNIIRFSIESVLRQTFTDWELLVIGDHCTDDTEAVVKSYDDPRIHFENLPENFGEQSKPNNVGVQRANGEFLAFLNHDDQWFPDHLESSLACLHEHSADLVYSPVLKYRPSSGSFITGPTRDGHYDPITDVPASAWLVKKESFESVGWFKPALELYTYPTNNWLWRARKCKLRMLCKNRLTVLFIDSQSRKNSYKERLSEDYAYCNQQMKENPGFRDSLLEEVALLNSADSHSVAGAWRLGLKQAIRNSAYRLLIMMGIPPLAFKNAFRYGRKGGFLNSLRRRRGLGKLKERIR